MIVLNQTQMIFEMYKSLLPVGIITGPWLLENIVEIMWNITRKNHKVLFVIYLLVDIAWSFQCKWSKHQTNNRDIYREILVFFFNICVMVKFTLSFIYLFLLFTFLCVYLFIYLNFNKCLTYLINKLPPASLFVSF